MKFTNTYRYVVLKQVMFLILFLITINEQVRDFA